MASREWAYGNPQSAPLLDVYTDRGTNIALRGSRYHHPFLDRKDDLVVFRSRGEEGFEMGDLFEKVWRQRIPGWITTLRNGRYFRETYRIIKTSICVYVGLCRFPFPMPRTSVAVQIPTCDTYAYKLWGSIINRHCCGRWG